jgi:hypothetical protein
LWLQVHDFVLPEAGGSERDLVLQLLNRNLTRADDVIGEPLAPAPLPSWTRAPLPSWTRAPLAARPPASLAVLAGPIHLVLASLCL